MRNSYNVCAFSCFLRFMKRGIYLRILKLIYIYERNVKKKIAYFDTIYLKSYRKRRTDIKVDGDCYLSFSYRKCLSIGDKREML